MLAELKKSLNCWGHCKRKFEVLDEFPDAELINKLHLEPN